MADPRADMAALRQLGLPPPAPARPRPTATSPPAKVARGKSGAEAPARAPQARGPEKAKPRGRKRADDERKPVPHEGEPEGPSEGRRSHHTTVYLEGAARTVLEQRLRDDPEATVADAMLDAVRSALDRLQQEQAPPPGLAADDPLPPPPRRRRRRRIEDGRPVQVRLSIAEREALDRIAGELGLSVSALISASLLAGKARATPL